MDTDVGRSPASQGRAATPSGPGPAVSGKAGIPNAGFTPGPWHVQSDGQIWSNDHPVAEKITTGPWGDEGVDFITGERTLVHHWGTVATEEAKANARLIAASPELYEAADHMLVAHESESRTHYAAAVEKLRAALAKARGEVA